jgi:hypothetical protein
MPLTAQRSPLVRIFIANLLALRWALAWMGAWFGIGLLFLGSQEYPTLITKHSIWLWTITTFIYAAIRFYTCFVFDKVARGLSLLGSVIGFNLFGNVFLSFINNTAHGVAPDDLMILVILASEVWVCASTIADDRDGVDRRKH